MSEQYFGLHRGHLTARADQIAKRYGAWHVNWTEATGEKRGWFGCQSHSRFEQRTAEKVLAAIDAAGGFEALQFNPRGERGALWRLLGF